MEKIRKIASMIPYVIPRWMVRLYHWVQRYTRRIPVGSMNPENWRSLTPISRAFGFDRGLPIARYYIERFLRNYASDIQGHVLEIHDNNYTRKFGGNRVTKSDVLHVEEGNPLATIVADLTCANHIPSDTFDCIIFTQTLHVIYDVRAAIRTLYRILKPGGVFLGTFPGISPISNTDMDRWGDYWRFTTLSVRLLFEEVFPVENIKVRAHGNVLTAISYLHGLATEELTKQELSYHDPDYQLLITLKAVKST
ncbi:MAG: class I SAM-dependent methyltransferase [Candidatus Hodarchaeota archaeon]